MLEASFFDMHERTYFLGRGRHEGLKRVMRVSYTTMGTPLAWSLVKWTGTMGVL